MNELRVTNWLLAGIFFVMVCQLWLKLEREARADTLRLDSCITEQLNQTPQQYLHVVSHAARE